MNNVLINLEDLVANAIIELYKSDEINYVNMDSVMSYAEAITDYLFQKKIIPSVTINRETYEIFKNDCQEYYEMDEIANNNTLIKLKNDKSIEDLMFAFRNHTRPELLEAYISPEVLVALGIKEQKKTNSNLVLK